MEQSEMRLMMKKYLKYTHAKKKKPQKNEEWAG